MAQHPHAEPAPPRNTTIASVDKALRIIEHMATLGAQGAPLTDLARDLELNKSSLHHTLATLRARHWVEQDQEGRYHLGSTSSAIARWWSASDHITSALHPVLERICAECHELVHLGKLSEKSMVYLDKVEPDRPVRVWSQVGRRVPAALTSMGRALIGAMDPHTLDLDSWLTSIPTPAKNLRERLLQEIERVRTHGYAIEIEENEPGIACVGVPLTIVDRPIAAVSITMPIERCSQERLRELAALITSSVREAHLTDITPITPQP